eukprot:5965549-Prymnesium_polylepis.1
MLLYVRRGEARAESSGEAAEGEAAEGEAAEGAATPRAALAAEVRAEEADAAEVRQLKEASEVIAELTVVPDAALAVETSIQLHSDTPASELASRAAEAVAKAAEAVAADVVATPAAKAAAAAAASAAREGATGGGAQMRLRRWDALHGLPEQPLSPSELSAEGGGTLKTLCLAPKGAVLLETRPHGE